MTDSIRPILLVEDNPFDLDLAQRAFLKTKIPNPIQVARDGEEALSFLARWEGGETLPAFILLDLKLPKVDGLEVLRRVKSHDRYRIIPVVILTTSTEEQDIQSAYQLGANSYIVKPVDYHRFMEVADQLEAYWCRLNQLLGQ